VKAPIIVQPWWVSFTENYADTIMYIVFIIWAFFLGMIVVAILCPAARNMRVTLPWRRAARPDVPQESGEREESRSPFSIPGPSPLLAGGHAPVHSVP
jgi:hypothetical protein